MVTLLDIVEKYGGIEDAKEIEHDFPEENSWDIGNIQGFNQSNAQWRELLGSIEVDEDYIFYSLVANMEDVTEGKVTCRELAKALVQSTEIYKRKGKK